jgi:hypothetical protein
MRAVGRRPFFWAFVAAMLLALAGGGAVALLGRARVAERKGHPDTVAPGQAPADRGPTPSR